MRKTPEENKTVHCLGNGRACAYARGLDLFQLFGPDYSAPNAAQLLFEGGENIAFESERIPETAVWHHRVFDAGQPLGDITEFAAAAEPIILREIRFSRPARGWQPGFISFSAVLPLNAAGAFLPLTLPASGARRNSQPWMRKGGSR